MAATSITAASAGGGGRAHREGPGRGPSRVGAWPVLFIGPLMLGVAVFYYWPIITNLIVSTQRSNAFGGNPTFVGAENYTDLLTSADLPSAIRNTLIYTVLVLLGIPLSLAIAAMIELPGLRLKGLYRSMYFMPYLAMPMAVAQVWKIVFNGDFGLLNQLLKSFGIDSPPYWLVTPGWALLAVAVFGVWASIGFNVIILSSGLKAIPRELYEAASIDGASGWRQFLSITVPLLSPQIFFLTIMTTIGGFQLFDALYAMIGRGNPAEPHTRSLVALFYRQAFQNSAQGQGAAVAVVILLFVAVVTLVQFVGQKKWVHYV
ncbi:MULTISPECIES: carbohydrate ABC transporter permease [Actinomyces]|uniref:Sugar ABC transporter permease n=1 Tax=Actinomyces respiraculi TaxID=2744574 RepID=A0A7T0PXU4_9ACTO|nr:MULTISPECIES: sugar ABC transporter permease [Actinomyces]QPL06185.1 sugar ABC transporter permease [Actinomyces respiraculi]